LRAGKKPIFKPTTPQLKLLQKQMTSSDPRARKMWGQPNWKDQPHVVQEVSAHKEYSEVVEDEDDDDDNDE
jgi:hypothetical protein